MNKLINELDQILYWPKKPSDKQMIIQWLSEKFSFTVKYSEKEINNIINHNDAFVRKNILREDEIMKEDSKLNQAREFNYLLSELEKKKKC